MMRLGKDEIMFMNAMSSVSGINPRDCLIGNNLISFMVKENEMGSAIGKNGSNVNKLKKALNKNIELLPYSVDPAKFIGTAFGGISFLEIKIQDEEGKKILFARIDAENKKKLLQNMGKMKRIKELAKRNYEIDDIRIK